jgi:hypothetical protein
MNSDYYPTLQQQEKKPKKKQYKYKDVFEGDIPKKNQKKVIN